MFAFLNMVYLGNCEHNHLCVCVCVCVCVNKASIDLVTNILQNNIFKHINILFHMI